MGRGRDLILSFFSSQYIWTFQAPVIDISGAGEDGIPLKIAKVNTNCSILNTNGSKLPIMNVQSPVTNASIIYHTKLITTWTCEMPKTLEKVAFAH